MVTDIPIGEVFNYRSRDSHETMLHASTKDTLQYLESVGRLTIFSQVF